MKRIKTILKFFISFFLLFFVFSQIDIKKLFSIIQQINIFYFLLAFFIFNFSKIVSAIRLNYYFKELKITLSSKLNLILYYIGMFYNLFLPGGIGGDGYKAYILNKIYHTKYKHLIQALLFDRISGLVGLIFLTSLLFLFSSYSRIYLNIISFVILISIYPLFYIFNKKINRFMFYFKKTTLLGLLVQILQLLSALFIIISLENYNIPIIDFLVLFLISSVVSVLPITIGGIGVRELTFLYGLKIINHSPDIGVAFSFLFFLITMLSSLIGILFIHKPLLDFKEKS